MARRSPSARSACLRSEMLAHEPTTSSGLPVGVGDDLEGVLDPEVVAVAMAETVLDRAAAGLDQTRSTSANTCGASSGCRRDGQNFGILEHLPGGEAHDRVDVVADERALERARGLVRVHDARRDRHEVLHAARAPPSARPCVPRPAAPARRALSAAPPPRACARAVSVAKPTVPISCPASSKSTEAEISTGISLAVLRPAACSRTRTRCRRACASRARHL